MLISLHLSAAFDTIDHTILLSRLQTSFDISGLALGWFHSYLESVFVCIDCSTSSVTLRTTGVPQGSVFGPMLFPLFISPIAHIVSSYGLLQQQYADDTQLYIATSKDNYDTPVAKLELCLSTLHTWFCYYGLALNSDKSEAIVFGTTQCSRSLSITSTVNVAGTLVQVSNQVRILGVNLDSRLSIDAHISALSKSSFCHIRALRHIRPNLTLDCSKNITCSLVGCCVDYANSTLVGISFQNISRLQRLQSTLTHVVTCQRERTSIFKTLQELHWLPIKWCIDCKIATLTYKLLKSGEPAYPRSRITSKISRRALRSSADDRQLKPCSSHTKLDHAPFVVPNRQYGTACRMTLELNHLALSFEADSKCTFQDCHLTSYFGFKC